jgi:hypothetical protein
MKVNITVTATLDVSAGDVQQLLNAKPSSLAQAALNDQNLEATITVDGHEEPSESWLKKRLFAGRNDEG